MRAVGGIPPLVTLIGLEALEGLGGSQRLATSIVLLATTALGNICCNEPASVELAFTAGAIPALVSRALASYAPQVRA